MNRTSAAISISSQNSRRFTSSILSTLGLATGPKTTRLYIHSE